MEGILLAIVNLVRKEEIRKVGPKRLKGECVYFIFPFIYCIKRSRWVQKLLLTFGSVVLLA